MVVGKHPGSRRLLAPGHDDLAGADGFDDLELREHRDRGVHFEAVAGDQDDHRDGGEIHGLAAEMLGDLECLGAVLRRALDLDQDHFLGHRVVRGVLEAVDDVDQLGDLLDDLVEALRVAADADGHAREVRVAAFGDDQRVDVEAAAGEHLADPHQHARLVVHEDGERVQRAATRGHRGVGSVGGDDGLGHGKKMVDGRWEIADGKAGGGAEHPPSAIYHPPSLFTWTRRAWPSWSWALR